MESGFTCPVYLLSALLVDYLWCRKIFMDSYCRQPAGTHRIPTPMTEAAGSRVLIFLVPHYFKKSGNISFLLYLSKGIGVLLKS